MAETLAIEGGPPVITEPFPAWPIWDDREIKLVENVIRSGVWGIGAAAIEEFAQKFADFQHVKYAWPVANGTLAIELAIAALNIGPGDEVIVPDYTFMATAAAPMRLGVTPVLVDVDPNTFCIDPQLVEEAITETTRAIIPVHFGGLPCDMPAIIDIATRHNLYVIEDSAHAHGAILDNQYVGTFGQIGTFSLQASKTLNAGEGGVVVTNDQRLFEIMKSIQNTGRSGGIDDYHHYLCGSNLRIGALQAALLLGQMDRLEQQTDTRDRNGQVLDTLLDDIEGVRIQIRSPNVQRQGHYLYTFILEADVPRDAFRDALGKEGVPVETEYPAVHTLEFITKCDLGNGSFPVSDELAERSIWLEQRSMLGSEQQVGLIAEAVKKILNNQSALR